MSDSSQVQSAPVRFIGCFLVLLAALFASNSSIAQLLPGQPAMKLDFPSTSPGVPAYARLELLLPRFDVPNTKHWAAVVFYRDPACIPGDFDLGSFFHLPGPAGLGAFACPLLIEGHELWDNGPGIDLAPRYAFARNAVPQLPVWFVTWKELKPQLETGHVTIEDLQAMRSLATGHARWFEERLYPNGGADNPGISLRASGVLDAGGSFELAWDYADYGDVDEVVINIRGKDK